MKSFLPLLLAVLFLSPLSANVFAASNGTFYINNAYFKGNGKYDVVVHDPNKDTFKLYVNGKNPVKARVNKAGWATFQGVKLSGQSKLSFTKKAGLFKYTPVNYGKYVRVDGKQVQLSDTGIKHSYEDFYAWLTTDFDLQSQLTLGQSGFGDSKNNYQLATAVCNYTDSSFGPRWVACMQKRYGDYLKPDTFENDNWMGDYSTMVGDMNDALGLKEQYGDLSIGSSQQYKKDMQEAQTLYERLAVTN